MTEISLKKKKDEQINKPNKVVSKAKTLENGICCLLKTKITMVSNRV